MTERREEKKSFMKKLLVYLRPYRLQAILAPCFKLLEAAFELLVPLIMADIIDVGISSGDTAYILKKCLVLVGLGLCGFASATCAQRRSSTWGSFARRMASSFSISGYSIYR